MNENKNSIMEKLDEILRLTAELSEECAELRKLAFTPPSLLRE
jgi:hypothetical protein